MTEKSYEANLKLWYYETSVRLSTFIYKHILKKPPKMKMSVDECHNQNSRSYYILKQKMVITL
jgi:hypothetical protein